MRIVSNFVIFSIGSFERKHIHERDIMCPISRWLSGTAIMYKDSFMIKPIGLDSLSLRLYFVLKLELL